MSETQIGPNSNAAVDNSAAMGIMPTKTIAPTSRKLRGTVTADADVTAMAKISKIVNDLPTPKDRTTVIDWFINKFANGEPK